MQPAVEELNMAWNGSGKGGSSAVPKKPVRAKHQLALGKGALAGVLVVAVALAAYFLFFGATLVNQLRLRLGKPPIMHRSSDNVVNFRKAQRSAKKEADRVKKLPYTRKCAVCGKTDAEFPDLEFRYCSKCAGYHCFCSEHINSHIHFTE